MTMRTAEFSLPPLVNLKPAFGAKQPNVLPQGVNLTNLIPDSFTRDSGTEMATVNESASLRSGASLKQTIGLFAATAVASLGTLFAGSAKEAFAHGSSTQALHSVVEKLALEGSGTPVVKALEATAGGAVESSGQLLAHYSPYSHYHRRPVQRTRVYRYNPGGYYPPPTHYRDYPQHYRNYPQQDRHYPQHYRNYPQQDRHYPQNRH